MAVCRYFLQGNCWYGENCRFEHPRNTYNDFNQPNQFAALTPHSGTGQPNRGGRPGGAGGGASTNVKDLATDDIINIISQEMAQWEQTHMWQFSCFSYTKETSCLPGLEDMSHEEVRLKAYEAQKAGTFDSYKQWIAQLTSDYKAKKKELINPSPHMRIKLKSSIHSRQLLLDVWPVRVLREHLDLVRVLAHLVPSSVERRGMARIVSRWLDPANRTLPSVEAPQPIRTQHCLVPQVNQVVLEEAQTHLALRDQDCLGSQHPLPLLVVCLVAGWPRANRAEVSLANHPPQLKRQHLVGHNRFLEDRRELSVGPHQVRSEQLRQEEPYRTHQEQ